MEAKATLLNVIGVVFPNKILSKVSTPWVIFKHPWIICPEVRFVNEITTAFINFCEVNLLVTYISEIKNSLFTQKILS